MKCNRCKKIKYCNEFYNNSHNNCKLYCKKCLDDYHKNYVSVNKKLIIEYNRRKGKKRRMFLINSMGRKCNNCGFNDIRALQIDHIDGKGLQQIKTNSYSLNSPKWITYILNNPKKYQILCANCNWIKRFEKNETRICEIPILKINS